jgi:protein disulfide-isomerase A6
MKFSAVLLLVAAAAIVSASEDPTGSLEGVIDLTPDNFDSYVNSGRHALIEFYAPWCGHCKHLTPEYKKLGAAIQKDNSLKSRVVIGKVDADAHRSLGERFGVQGFPTIKFFNRGKPVDAPEDYSGPRKGEDMLEYVKQKVEADKGWARVEILDTLAQQFRGAPDASSLIAQLTEKAGSLTEDAQKTAGDLYVKYGQKAVEKGSDFFQTEYDRLDRLLSSGKVGGSKSAEISRKLSVLGAFLEEKYEEVKEAVTN